MTALPAPLSVAPVTGVPRVEMAAEHDHFVADARISAGNFGDDVDASNVSCDLDVELQFDSDGLLPFRQPGNPAVVFAREHE